jgi:hypothetical protein
MQGTYNIFEEKVFMVKFNRLSFFLLAACVIWTACKTSSKESEQPKPENIFLMQQLSSSLKTYNIMRNDIGVYADAVTFDGRNVPCSVASVGMALVSLCIADATDNDAEAEQKALQTMRAFAGKVNGFQPARNPVNGFFRHWIDMDTGARAWNSEYSSIDSGILVAGALFCKSYFASNSEITQLADSLYLTVNWSTAIGDIDEGGIWMVSDDEGNGSLPAKPFNEYMITAWLAKNDLRDNTRATALWNKHYADPSALPKKTYEGYDLLTDGDHYLSNFVIQFPYYLCHPFTSSESYLNYLTNAMHADLEWWTLNTDQPAYIWGTGAGPALVGYHADSFDSNPGQICSPQIIAGFIPVRTQCLDDLEQLWESGFGRYDLPEDTTQVLWRFSIIQEEWMADGAAGVDWSTMVFGLAAHPDALGSSFFRTYNNFQFPLP